MTDSVNVLLIDDDAFIHKYVKKELEPHGFVLEAEFDGASGIEHAIASEPEIILLDVEMPGLSGYEVCENLRQNNQVKDIPIIFLSSRNGLQERLQAYEVGADDYITKPFETEALMARLRILARYSAEKQELSAQYKIAEATARTAISGVSEFGLAIKFMEEILPMNSLGDSLEALLATLSELNLDCCMAYEDRSGGVSWHSRESAISPLEKELIETSSTTRFMDFGCRTLVTFAPIRILIKNMPLEDMNRYGRIKDLVPVMLSAVTTKIRSLETLDSLLHQGEGLSRSLKKVRKNLYDLANILVTNKSRSQRISDDTMHELTMSLLTMGLEEDQELKLTDQIEEAFARLLKALDPGQAIKTSFKFILAELEESVNQQERLLQEFIDSQTKEPEKTTEPDDNIELF